MEPELLAVQNPAHQLLKCTPSLEQCIVDLVFLAGETTAAAAAAMNTRAAVK